MKVAATSNSKKLSGKRLCLTRMTFRGSERKRLSEAVGPATYPKRKNVDG
jgi:hypothetical protein